jgi:hypothetical protein
MVVEEVPVGVLELLLVTLEQVVEVAVVELE